MKTRNVFVVAVLVCLFSSFSFAQTNPIKIPVPFHTTYIPHGFDSNDRAQVVIEGNFSNTCYKVAPYKVETDESKQTVTVVAMAYYYQNTPCLEVMIPFSQVIDLGILKSGDYQVVDYATNKQMGNVDVAQARNPGPDDFLYAPVDEVHEAKDATGLWGLRLRGVFRDSCMKIKSIDMTVEKNVVLVLPIIVRTNHGKCTPGNFPFDQVAKLKTNPPKGRYLFHVRALNGQAINKLADLY